MGFEKRKEPRYGVQLPAKVRNGQGRARDGYVTDLSATGCRFYSKTAHLGPGSFFTVTLGPIGFIDATVAWCVDAFYGIRFERPLYVAVVDHLCRNFPVPEAANSNRCS